MRKITKTNPINSFSAFCVQNPNATWSDFHSQAYQCYLDTRYEILVCEQNCLCGYTEIPVAEAHHVHIDHYRKRSMFPNQTFVWQNLIASCNDEDYGAKYKDNSYPLQQSDYSAMYNPVVDSVENYFYYNQRGEIEPQAGISEQDQRKVQKTIDVFNLNHASLRSRRQTIINQIKSCVGLSKEDVLGVFSNSGFPSVVLQEAI